jgi:vitamin B12 transporter
MIAHVFVTPDLIRGSAFLRPESDKAAKPRIKSGATMALVLALFPTTAFAQQETSLRGPCPGPRAVLTLEDLESVFIIPCETTDITVTAAGIAQLRIQTGRSVTSLDHETIDRRQSTSVADLLSTTPGITVSRNGGPGQPTAVRIRGAEDAQTLVLIDGVRVNDPASPGGAFDFGNLLTGNIDRIEVLRGPNSVPWGSQAIGGVVNIVTAPVNGANLRAEYGYRNSKQVVGQAGGSFGIVTASLGGGYFDDGGISAYKNGTERDGYRQYAGNARVGVAISDAVSLDLRGYFADSRVSFDGYPPPFYSFADTRQFAKTQQIFGYAGLNVAMGAVKHRLAFTLSDTARDSFDPEDSFNNFIARGRIERFEYQGDATMSDAIRAVFGIEHETSRFRDGFARYSTGVTSGYLQAIVKPFDALTLTGGVRVDDHRNYGTKATVSGNAAWRVGSATIIRASYGEGYKAPTLYQLYSFYGNERLRPETAQSYDIGIEQSLIDGTFKLGLTAFHRDTTNQIDFSFAPNPARPFGFYDNIAKTRAEGIEATVEMRPTTNLTLSANYTLTDTKDRSTGLALLRRPKHSVNASIDWTAHEWLKLGASLQTVSDSRDFDFQTFDPTNLDGYTLATIRAAVPIGEHFEFYGRIENLFDVKYETVSGYGTLGRNAHVGVRAKF